ncbi:TrmB family transcriptional regulator [Halegenticoccus tardaugens]|uniref:TrmB family transcriptional regulator n=1 Tax=Halegenticoccus tardaugens TaxID=2071624 RepID=UPI00100BD86C|nr:helix-turn-helix domain-containing protein [Halegenticoccus tardaugens]
MTENSPDREDDIDAAISRGISLLGKLGMTEYAARTFLALYRLGGGTAREVSDASSVPRTKVYDVVEELKEHGLVEIRHSNPREYYPASKQLTRQKFEREYQRSVTELFDILSALPPAEATHQVDGLWVVTGRDAIYDRMGNLIQSADERIVFIAIDGDLPSAIIEPLGTELDQDVEVVLGGLDTVESEELDGATVIPSVGVWADADIKFLLMIDQASVFIVSPETANGELSGLWCTERRNVLVAAFQPMIDLWLNTEG